MDLESKLRDKIDKDAITKIWITDMDGTLLNTATKDWGIPFYEKHTGEQWPHKGWWGRLESMDPEIFPNDVVPEMQGEYDKVKDDPTVLKVVMTGRMKQKNRDFSGLIKDILGSKDLLFDVYALNTGGETSSVKVKQMTKLLSMFPNVTSMVMFEDRDEHMPKFKEFGESLKGVDFELVKIVPPTVRFE